MSTPEPVAPPPKNSTKKWLLGCLVALLLLVLIGIAVLVLGVYAAKKQVDAMTEDASRVYEDARRAAKALESAQQVAPDIAQGAEARMRLGRVAAAVMAADLTQAEGCPPDPARAALPVDAQWMRDVASGLPAASVGTPWMREPAVAAVTTEVALDRVLGEAGSIAVIHTKTLVEPKAAVEGGEAQDGEFEGFVQLLGYPDGETICIAPFRASGSGGEFQARFRAAAEAAVGK